MGLRLQKIFPRPKILWCTIYHSINVIRHLISHDFEWFWCHQLKSTGKSVKCFLGYCIYHLRSPKTFSFFVTHTVHINDGCSRKCWKLTHSPTESQFNPSYTDKRPNTERWLQVWRFSILLRFRVARIQCVLFWAEFAFESLIVII